MEDNEFLFQFLSNLLNLAKISQINELMKQFIYYFQGIFDAGSRIEIKRINLFNMIVKKPQQIARLVIYFSKFIDIGMIVKWISIETSKTNRILHLRILLSLLKSCFNTTLIQTNKDLFLIQSQDRRQIEQFIQQILNKEETFQIALQIFNHYNAGIIIKSN